MLCIRDLIYRTVCHMKKLGPEMQIISPFMKLLVQMKRILLFWLETSWTMRLMFSSSVFILLDFQNWLPEEVVLSTDTWHCSSVLNASDSAWDLWFWKLELFWKSFQWLASKHEHQKANGILEYEVMIYMTSLSSVKNAGPSHPWGHMHRTFLFCHGLLIKYF